MGYFPDFEFGIRSEFSIDVAKELFAENHQVASIAHLRADTGVFHPESFAVLKGHYRPVTISVPLVAVPLHNGWPRIDALASRCFYLHTDVIENGTRNNHASFRGQGLWIYFHARQS